MPTYSNNYNSKYKLELIVTPGTQSIPNNTTAVTATLNMVKLSGSGNWSNNKISTWNMTINGVKRSGTYTFDFRGTTTLRLHQETFTIAHNSDGSKSIVVSASSWADLATPASATIGNQTVTLTTIPRASSFTLGGSTSTGGTVTVAISRATSSFTHLVQWRMGNGAWKTAATAATTTASFVVPHSELPSATSGTITVSVQTKSGSTNIGSATTRTRSMSVPGNIVPNITSVSISEVEQSVIDKNLGIGYIQSKSRVKVDIIGATPGDGSSIKAYSITIEGNGSSSTKNWTTSPLANSGAVKVTTTVTDNRNRLATRVDTIQVVAYEPPKLTKSEVFRSATTSSPDPFGTHLTVLYSASASSLGNKNTLLTTIYSTPVGGYYSSQLTESGMNQQDKKFTIDGYDATLAYNIKITLDDIFGKVEFEGAGLYIPTAEASLFVGSKGLASSFGKIPTHGKTYDLEIGAKGIYSDGPIYQNDGIEVPNGYVGILPSGNANSGAYWRALKNGSYFKTDTTLQTNQLSQFGHVWAIDMNIRNPQEKTILWKAKVDGHIWHSGTNHSTTTMQWKMLLDDSNVADYVQERGSNADGKWEKWKSGKLRQWGSIEKTININTAYGSLFRSAGNEQQKFPLSFNTIETLFISSNYHTSFGAYINARSVNSFTWRPVHINSQNAYVIVSWEAQGTWK